MISDFDCGLKKGTGFVFMLNAHMYSLINRAFPLSFLLRHIIPVMCQGMSYCATHWAIFILFLKLFSLALHPHS